MLSPIFTLEDRTVYTTWDKEEGGIVILFIPGIGEIRFTLGKAEEIAESMARQVEYGRWNAMEERQKEQEEKSQKKPTL